MILKINGTPIDLGDIDVKEVVSNINVLELPINYVDFMHNFMHTPVHAHLRFGSTHLFNGDLNPLNAIAKAGQDILSVIQNLI